MDYKLVKHCRYCKKRFLADRGQSRRIYCNPCEKKVAKLREKENK